MKKPFVTKSVAVGLNPGNVGSPEAVSKEKAPKPKLSKGARFAASLKKF